MTSPAPHQKVGDTVAVIVDRSADNVYIPTVVVSDDLSIPLPGEAAERYASVVLMAAEYARYDAAIIAQLRHLAADKPESYVNGLLAVVLHAMIDNRPELDLAATAPLRFQPIVSASTGLPYIHLWVNGRRACQWAVEDAVRHAMHVLQATVNAGLDAVYHQVMRTVVGVEAELAAAAIDGLVEHRREESQED